MKTVGIVGGIAPESTVQYYRLIIQSYRKHQTDGTYPKILINSIDLRKMLGFVERNELGRLVDYLVDEIRTLEIAGADFGAFASNTPHIVFDEIREKTSLKLISIVEATCDAARDGKLTRVGLFGTRFTMQGRFYPDVFSKANIALVTPSEDEQRWIHDKYMSELVNGIFLPETRQNMLAIADRMRKDDGVQAVILGGTELPLLLPEVSETVFLDTTRIHAERIVAELTA